MSNNKLTSRQKQAIKTKNKIFNTGVKLIEKYGFDNITMEKISKESSVSIGAIYHYYNSKNEILFDNYKKADDYFEKIVQKDLEGKNSKDGIVSFFSHYGNYINSRGLAFNKELYVTKNKNFVKEDRYMQKLLLDLIISGQKNNEIISNYTPKYISEYLFVLARGTVFHWCLKEGDFDLQERIIEYMKHTSKIFFV